MVHVIKILYLIVGGVIGTLARYSVGGVVQQAFGAKFPYGTFVVNIAGCFLIGVLATFAEGKFFLESHTRLFLVVGFCGAFTTFSTFMLETTHLLKDGQNLHAFTNVLGSVLIGLVALRLGTLLGEAF